MPGPLSLLLWGRRGVCRQAGCLRGRCVPPGSVSRVTVTREQGLAAASDGTPKSEVERALLETSSRLHPCDSILRQPGRWLTSVGTGLLTG